MISILTNYFSVDVIDREVIYEGSIVIPTCGQWKDFKDSIKSLSDFEDVGLIGLHPNALIRFRTAEATKLLGNILKMKAKNRLNSRSPAGVEDMASSLIEILPRPILQSELSIISQNRVKNGAIDPILSFLNHEIIRFNKLLDTCRNYLIELNKALKGRILMSEDLENIYQSLLNNTPSKLWLKYSYPSLKSLPF